MFIVDIDAAGLIDDGKSSIWQCRDMANSYVHTTVTISSPMLLASFLCCWLFLLLILFLLLASFGRTWRVQHIL